MNAATQARSIPSEAKSAKGTILRYRADRRSVAFVLAGFAVHLAAFGASYALAPAPAATWLAALSLIPSSS